MLIVDSSWVRADRCGLSRPRVPASTRTAKRPMPTRGAEPSVEVRPARYVGRIAALRGEGIAGGKVTVRRERRGLSGERSLHPVLAPAPRQGQAAYQSTAK